MLADKVSGNLLGLWLLVPEHLRLGTWDLLCGWSGQPGERVEPRLALQLVHEAALCKTGIRQHRGLTQKGFELVNGLPWLASDRAVHELLAARSVAEAERLQEALGRIRRASGHYRGQLLAIDPHRLPSHSKRRMRQHRKDNASRPIKMAQTFFLLDVETRQPVCFITGTASRSVSQATPELLRLGAAVLQPRRNPLVLADCEHCTGELFDHVHAQTPFDLMTPMPKLPGRQRQLAAIPPEQFDRRWAGYATLKRPYQLTSAQHGPYHQYVQRQGETAATWNFQAFLATGARDEVEALTQHYPQRWHVEEFFNTDQALGWKRAGTQNLNIRYGHMTLALLAQAALHQLRQRLGAPVSTWDASHLASALLAGLEGDVRVSNGTILVTYYNAPHAEQLRHHYEHLPSKLRHQNLDPRVPWLYNLQLDFRFR